MAKQLLIDSFGEFVIDRKKLQEDSAGKSGRLTAKGPLSFCDVVNGNRRRYPRSVWETNLKEDSQLRKRMSASRAFGLLEHPADGKVTHQSPISHVVVDAKLNLDGSVTGDIVFVDTPEGRRMQALVDIGYNPTVSSRGYGTLVKDDKGIDVVQDDYICEGWDVVMEPSFERAEVIPSRPDVITTTTESKKISETTEPLSPAGSIPGKVNPEGKATRTESKRITNNPMDATAIRSQLQSIATTDKLDPKRFAEGHQLMENLHHVAESWCNEDAANRRWETQRLHEEISAQQTKWASIAAEPSVQLKRITEQRDKLVQVTHKVIETGVKFKDRLKESLEANGKLVEANTKNLHRGKGWKKFAEGLRSEKMVLEKKYAVATLACSMLAEKYKAKRAELRENILGLVKLGRKLVQVEHAEALKTKPELVEKLKKATTLDEIVAVQDVLEGKTTKTPVAKVTEGKEPTTPATPQPDKAAVAPKVTESKETPAPVQDNSESKVSQLGRIVLPVGNPSSIAESIAISRRLSEANGGK